MKNAINYYYNLFAEEIRVNNGCYIFKIKRVEYNLIPFYGDIKELLNVYNLVIQYKKYCHEIIFNKDNSVTTIYNNIPYILIKKNINLKEVLKLNDIINYMLYTYNNKSLNWKELWQKKMDYYEYQIGQLGIKYPTIRESFDYYLGMCETAISLINYVDYKNIKNSICHIRLDPNLKLSEFYNPLNLICDARVRDVAEYIKLKIISTFNFVDIEFELENILFKCAFNKDEVLLLFARIIFPSFYFDIYDQIISSKAEENKILYIIKNNSKYEYIIKKIYHYLNDKYSLPVIEWLYTTN